MTLSRFRLLAALGLVALAVSFFKAPAKLAAQKAPSAKLAVLIVLDQFRGDFLTRWDKPLGDGGFHRLETEGAWFQNCHYPYGSTFTGAGHSSLATGCSPDKHGIIQNDWY